MIKCWFGRHDFTYWTVGGTRTRGCNRCGRRWRRVRYDHVLVWVRLAG